MTAFDEATVLDEVGAELGINRDDIKIDRVVNYGPVGHAQLGQVGTLYLVELRDQRGPRKERSAWYVARDMKTVGRLALASTKRMLEELQLPRGRNDTFWDFYREEGLPDPQGRANTYLLPTKPEISALAKTLVDRYGVEVAIFEVPISIRRYGVMEHLHDTPSGFVYWWGY